MSNPNAISWFEIPVKNIDQAQRFYETLLGKSLHREVFPMGGQDYTLAIFAAPDEGVKGCLQSGADTTEPSTQGTLAASKWPANSGAPMSRAFSAAARTSSMDRNPSVR